MQLDTGTQTPGNLVQVPRVGAVEILVIKHATLLSENDKTADVTKRLMTESLLNSRQFMRREGEGEPKPDISHSVDETQSLLSDALSLLFLFMQIKTDGLSPSTQKH